MSFRPKPQGGDQLDRSLDEVGVIGTSPSPGCRPPRLRHQIRSAGLEPVVLRSSVDEALLVERRLTAVVRHYGNAELDQAVVGAGADAHDVDDMGRKVVQALLGMDVACAFAMWLVVAIVSAL